MLSILNLHPTILAYRADGKITRADIDRVFAELDAKMTQEGRLRVYTEVSTLEGITPEALWRDLRLGIPRLDVLLRIERAALVTDIDWLRKAAIWEDRMLLGSLHMRTFTMAGLEDARAWIRAPAEPVA